ncbi:hypothetical protein HYV84_03245 [Candidatus Woesearchaeota archaeon]|nr:hypothetical protein [Candidatus Woesearchaeota archaeon]
MALELSLEEGVQESIRILEGVRERPILVAVYGWRDSGKSHIISRLADYFESKGMSAGRGEGGPSPSTFMTLRDTPQFLNQVLFFHCGWEKAEWLSDNDHEDPNILAREIAKKRIHLNVGVYNPQFNNKPEGEYDLIISNSGSKRKYRR